MGDRVYRNEAQVVGLINNAEFDADRGRSGAGRVGIRADESMVYVQMWERTDDDDNSLRIVENFIKGLTEGRYIDAAGELNEWESEGEYRRQIVNRMVSKKKEKVYNMDVLDTEDTNELAIVTLAGDVLESDCNLTSEVQGKKVNEETPRLDLTLVTFNFYNPKTDEEDLTPREVLINEINRSINYLEENNKSTSLFEKMKGKLENDKSDQAFYDVLKQFVKNGQSYNINTFHLTAYGDLAENIDDEVNTGDNITVGCDILNTQVRNKYNIAKGTLNEIEIGYYAGINEKSGVSEGGINDDNDVPW